MSDKSQVLAATSIIDIGRYLYEFCFGHRLLSHPNAREGIRHIFFFGRNIRFHHLEILRFLLLSTERITEQKKTQNNFTKLLVKY